MLPEIQTRARIFGSHFHHVLERPCEPRPSQFHPVCFPCKLSRKSFYMTSAIQARASGYDRRKIGIGEKQEGERLFTPTEKKQKKDVDDIATYSVCTLQTRHTTQYIHTSVPSKAAGHQ